MYLECNLISLLNKIFFYKLFFSIIAIKYIYYYYYSNNNIHKPLKLKQKMSTAQSQCKLSIQFDKLFIPSI